MKVSVVRPDELGDSELQRWRTLQQADPTLRSPFLSPEFICAVGALRQHVRVAVLEEGADLVGFFPFERHPFGVGKPVAAGLTDAQGIVLAQDVELDRRLIAMCGLVVYEYDHLVEGQPLADFGRPRRYPSPIIDLRHGFDTYLDAIKHTSGTTLRRTLAKARKLEREVGPLHHEYASDRREPLATLLRWKSNQYRRTGRTDRFAQRWIVELVERLHTISTPNFAGVLDMLYVDDQPLAGHFGPRTETTMAAWFPAYNPAYAKYSPGLIQHLALAQAAARNGLELIDLGRGDKEYKDKLKNGELAVLEGRVASPGVRAALHWLMRTPALTTRAAVVADPLLHRGADRALKTYGRIRTTTGPGPSPPARRHTTSPLHISRRKG